QKDVLKQQNRLKAFAKVGRPITSEYDFSFLEPIERDSRIIDQAFSAIQLDADKVFHSLFWFISINGIDSTVINYLVAGEDDNTSKAVDILLKITKSRLPTSGNFSSYSNLGTLFLSSDNQSHIQKGISLKLTLIESASFDDYLAAIMGSNNYGENPKNIAQKFCD